MAPRILFPNAVQRHPVNIVICHPLWAGACVAINSIQNLNRPTDIPTYCCFPRLVSSRLVPPRNFFIVFSLISFLIAFLCLPFFFGNFFSFQRGRGDRRPLRHAAKGIRSPYTCPTFTMSLRPSASSAPPTSPPPQHQQQKHPAGTVPITKLPSRRHYTSEARENMNCKSCRKRKVGSGGNRCRERREDLKRGKYGKCGKRRRRGEAWETWETWEEGAADKARWTPRM